MANATALSEAVTGTAYSTEVTAANESSLSAYDAFCATAIYAPPQHPLWVRAWLSGTGENGLIAFLRDGGRPVLALALEVTRQGVFKVARFPGGQHANGNFPALDLAREALDAGAVEALVAAIHAARPDIDLLALERQRRNFEGVENPFLLLPRSMSPNVSLAVDLTVGPDVLFHTGSGKRKTKKQRTWGRKLEAAGGVRRYAATTVAEVDALLDLFFELKHKRLLQKGLPDVFGGADVQARFRTLFRSALQEEVPPFVLHALEAGGKVRALTGSSRTKKSIVCDFSAFAEDELVVARPGSYLFYENIAEASAEGLEVYDFSVGEEPYKRLWCDLETWHADVFCGLTTRGRLFVPASRALVGLKRRVKNNPTLARLAHRLRKASAADRNDKE